MKNISLNLFLTIVFGGVILLGACNDDNLCNEAKIVNSFTVKGVSGTMLNGVIGDDNKITLRVSPHVSAEVELNGVTPVFYLSKGATVSPDPREPQNFAQAGGVNYTVTAEDGKTRNVYTVVWDITDPLPYGEGFGTADAGVSKTFPELGYPGTVANYDLPSIEYGDLLMYHAYCGNYIVLVSRVYIDENPSSPHCVKVVDKTTLAPAGINLNLGSISLANLKMITSDYKGRCVAAVINGGSTEFFYWTTPTAAPVSIGTINVNMASPAGANFQVAGDITGNAWITAQAPLSTKGEHYRVKVMGGQLAAAYNTLETGYSSSDCSWFQMISPFDDSDNPSFVVGDTEGTAAASNSIKCYVRSPAGTTTQIMPGFWNNTLPVGHHEGTWWVGTGMSTARNGGRSPIVSALPINGKTYVVVAGGSGYYHAAAVLTSDLQTLAHAKLDIAPAQSISRGWCYGAWADWYYDDDLKEAHLSIWFGRLGLYTFKISCFE